MQNVRRTSLCDGHVALREQWRDLRCPLLAALECVECLLYPRWCSGELPFSWTSTTAATALVESSSL